MEKKTEKGVGKYLAAGRRRRRWQRVVTALASLVVFCTTYLMILPAITLTVDEGWVRTDREAHVYINCPGEAQYEAGRFVGITPMTGPEEEELAEQAIPIADLPVQEAPAEGEAPPGQTVTPAPVRKAVAKAAPAATPVPTPEPTAIPEEIPEQEPDAEPSEEPTATPEETPEQEPDAEPVEEPTATPEETPEQEPDAEPVEDPTATPEETPEQEPDAEPVEDPTATPEETPEQEPDAEPGDEPTDLPEEELPDEEVPEEELPAEALDPEVHIHSADCYGEDETGVSVLVCEEEGHVHTPDCLDEDGTQTCGFSDYFPADAKLVEVEVDLVRLVGATRYTIQGTLRLPKGVRPEALLLTLTDPGVSTLEEAAEEVTEEAASPVPVLYYETEEGPVPVDLDSLDVTAQTLLQSELPHTGGSGLFGWYLSGAAALLAAAGLWIQERRKRGERS